MLLTKPLSKFVSSICRVLEFDDLRYCKVSFIYDTDQPSLDFYADDHEYNFRYLKRVRPIFAEGWKTTTITTTLTPREN
jgi:hypothetical protein